MIGSNPPMSMKGMGICVGEITSIAGVYSEEPRGKSRWRGWVDGGLRERRRRGRWETRVVVSLLEQAKPVELEKSSPSDISFLSCQSRLEKWIGDGSWRPGLSVGLSSMRSETNLTTGAADTKPHLRRHSTLRRWCIRAFLW